jgi:hypothetical protein
MKTLSGTFVFKLVILVAIATASIVLVSACEKSPAPATGNPPIVICMNEPGVKVKASSQAVEKAFDDLIAKHGKEVCNVDYYHDHPDRPDWHRGQGRLCMTSAVRSEAGGTPAPADPSHLVQRVALDTLDEAQQFLSTINP